MASDLHSHGINSLNPTATVEHVPVSFVSSMFRQQHVSCFSSILELVSNLSFALAPALLRPQSYVTQAHNAGLLKIQVPLKPLELKTCGRSHTP